MTALLILMLAVAMAVHSLRQYRRQHQNISLVMLMFWCVLALQVVTGLLWLQVVMVLLILPAGYLRFFAKPNGPGAATSGPTEPPTDQGAPATDAQAADFDLLMDAAEQQANRAHLTRLNHALFSLPQWWTVLVKRDGQMRPYVGVIEDTPALLLFTDVARAQAAFALIERLGVADEVQVGPIITTQIVRDASPYLALGVQRLQFNSRYYLPLAGLRDQYYYVMRPHDFKSLAAAAETDDAALLALWQALFDLPKWFFLLNRQGKEESPTLIGAEFDGNHVVFLFLSYDYAVEQAQRLTSERGGEYDVHVLPPAQGYQLILDAKPDGVLLRDEGVSTGWKLEKLSLAYEHFCTKAASA
jgi:hypothetical protein